jgi:predicted permease
MEETFRELLASARARGGRTAELCAALSESLDVAAGGLHERIREHRGRGGGVRHGRAPRWGSWSGGGGMESIWSDVRFALRTFVRQPAFTLAVLVTLALGIGANTAIFTVVNAVLLRPLPYPDPERLVRVYPVALEEGSPRASFSLPDFRDWRARSTSLDEMGLYSTLPSGLVLVGESGPAVELETAYVAGGFFQTLGVPPLLGRTFGPEADEEGLRQVVLSHTLWSTRFGGDPGVVGRTVTLNHLPFEVAGVMPPGFMFPEPPTAAWAPLTVIPLTSIPTDRRNMRAFQAVGRLAAGQSEATAGEELSSVAGALLEQYPEENEGLGSASVVSLREEVVGGGVTRTLLLLLGAVGCILLIACTNVANLLLARGSGRRAELATRIAMGAAPGRVVRQLLTESLALGLAGGALGASLSLWGTRAFLARSAGLIPRSGEVDVDPTVLGFAALLTVAATILFGALPALRAVRDLSLREAIGSDARAAGTLRGVEFRRILVGVQVALAVVLVSGAGLMMRSLAALRDVDPGFDSDQLVALHLTISAQKYPTRPEYLGFYHRLMEEIARVPGVREVGSIRYLPLLGAGEMVGFNVPSEEALTGAQPERYADLIQVSAGLFATMGVTVLEGRAFSSLDGPQDPPVAVVNEAFVGSFLGGGNAVGQTLDFGLGSVIPIVGVVEDVRHRGLDQLAHPTIYAHQEQIPRRGMAVVARVDRDPDAVLPELGRVVSSLDADQPISLLTRVGDAVSGSIARPRFLALLMGSFGGLALILGAVGVHGLVAYQVGGRRREIGIRMALGAGRARTVSEIVRQGVAPAAIGVLAGTVIALLLSRLAGALLFGVSPTDPLTYLLVALTLLVVSLSASALPARRAVGVAPSEALREG